MNKLKSIFDNCAWSRKVEGAGPEKTDEILYIWREHEYKFAQPFFGTSGAAILKEDDLMVERTLHYYENERGVPTLVVHQRSKPITNMEEIAANMARAMDVTLVQESWDRACSGETKC